MGNGHLLAPADIIDSVRDNCVERVQQILALRQALRCLPLIFLHDDDAFQLRHLRALCAAFAKHLYAADVTLPDRALLAQSPIEPNAASNASFAVRGAVRGQFPGECRSVDSTVARSVELSLADSFDAFRDLHSDGVLWHPDGLNGLRSVLAEQILADQVDAEEYGSGFLVTERLWRHPSKHLSEAPLLSELGLRSTNSERTWGFWQRWFSGFIEGDPISFSFQKRVANIPDGFWEAGPEAVAEEIARIEAAYELRQRIVEVEADQPLIEERRLGIGGNNPPEEIDDPETAQQVVILWESIAGLREEVEADEPDARRVAALIERLGAALKAVIAWCGRKGDLIVDTSIKWGIPAAGGGYFFLNPSKAEAVLKAAQAWLPFLAP